MGDRLVQMGGTVIFSETPETTGAKHILAKQFATPELGAQFIKIHKDYMDLIESKGADLLTYFIDYALLVKDILY